MSLSTVGMTLQVCRVLRMPLGMCERLVIKKRHLNTAVYEDLHIPVPFGHLSGRAWGSKTGHPVLCLHGWQDNLGTFEPLLPYMDSSLRLVAIDFPGHGLSSRLPAGTFYHYMDNLVIIRMVLRHLNWTKHSLIGHSMGGSLALMYAGIFPDNVETVAILDIYKPATNMEELPNITRDALETAPVIFSKMNRTAPSYSKDKMVRRFIEGSFSTITKEAAEILLKRGCKPSEDGTAFEFSRDLRLGIPSVQHMDTESTEEFLSGVKCNLIVIKAVPGLNIEDEKTLKHYKDMYNRNCSRFVYREVPGGHHVHMDKPETIAEIINPFLLKQYKEN